MSGSDSIALCGTLRNWPTLPILGFGVPDIADKSSFDLRRLPDCTQWTAVAAVKGPDSQQQRPATLIQTCSSRPRLPPRLPSRDLRPINVAAHTRAPPFLRMLRMSLHPVSTRASLSSALYCLKRISHQELVLAINFPTLVVPSTFSSSSPSPSSSSCSPRRSLHRRGTASLQILPL